MNARQKQATKLEPAVKLYNHLEDLAKEGIVPASTDGFAKLSKWRNQVLAGFSVYSSLGVSVAEPVNYSRK